MIQLKKFKNYSLTLILFVAPTLLLFTVLVAYPIVEALYGGMLDWDGISSGTWIGFENYKKLFFFKLISALSKKHTDLSCSDVRIYVNYRHVGSTFIGSHSL